MEKMLAHFAGRVNHGVIVIVRSVSTKILILFLKHMTLSVYFRPMFVCVCVCIFPLCFIYILYF